MALPPAEIDRKPWYEAETRGWSALTSRAQSRVISGIALIVLWFVFAIVPALDYGHEVIVCGRLHCTVLPTAYFALEEGLLAAVMLGLAGSWFFRVYREVHGYYWRGSDLEDPRTPSVLC
ncbi:MAG: hypothetical protein L3K23_02075 [Thermoplasmata archaeon]|nr:hypothetical protein [Thermoplasmata archaeon]